MSYGQQLNIFRAGSHRWGPDWHAAVLVHDRNELKVAAEDAADLLGGRYSKSEQVLYMPSGAKIRFFEVRFPLQAEKAFRGMAYTQIAWLHRPSDKYADEIINMARSALRSRVVPSNELRYEYLNVI